MKIIVKNMTSEIKRLDIVKMKRRNFANALIFVPAIIKAHYENRANLAEFAVFETISATFPELKDLNQELRKDYTIVFSEYPDK